MTNFVCKSLQLELDAYLKLVTPTQMETSISKQAFSKARKKLSHHAFIALNETLVKEFYSDNEYSVWKGYRRIGIDGSTVQLPSSQEIIKDFGFIENQHTKLPMARISCAYDLDNDLSLDARIGRYQHSEESKKLGKNLGERELAFQHIQAIIQLDDQIQPHYFHQNDLFLCDMGYPALDLIAWLIWIEKDFVFRCSTAFLKEVQQAVALGKQDQVVKIPLKTSNRCFPKRLKTLTPQMPQSTVISLRVLLIDLDSGEQEILITSLMDKQAVAYDEFSELYEDRWGSETHYSTLKNGCQLENFTGLSAQSIRQDFYATVFTNNLRGLIQTEVQQTVEQDNQNKKRKYRYKVNTNLAIGRLKDKLVQLLIAEGDLIDFYEQLKDEIQRGIVPIRPGRTLPRNKKKGRKKYNMNQKRVI